ncbi:MAG: ATP-binding cassette domain-containing protein [Desulfobulbaceae bacterium]|nr:ATP-binding cassette domain-containing protein [Desulfobulbaceae bacterium]
MQLKCSNLTYCYPGANSNVLENVQCSLSRPGFHSIFGPSGVGKSSFARLIADEKRYDYHGELLFNGLKTILYSYNQERLPGWSSAGAHLDKVVAAEKKQLKQELIDTFNLTSLLGSRFHQLSMGQQNRMNLIRYLLQDFDLLILDESLANVDEKMRQTIILTIKRIFPEKMFLYISHNLMEVSTFCDEVIVFGGGAKGKRYIKIPGQNCCSAESIDRQLVDKNMLEIMNAF